MQHNNKQYFKKKIKKLDFSLHSNSLVVTAGLVAHFEFHFSIFV